MNRENFRKLRDHLIALRDVGEERKFGMSAFFLDVPSGDATTRYTECRTACCLAGWSLILKNKRRRDFTDCDCEVEAAKWLGLEGMEINYVFFGHWARNRGWPDLRKITLEQAVDYLTACLERGHVRESNWYDFMWTHGPVKEEEPA